MNKHSWKWKKMASNERISRYIAVSICAVCGKEYSNGNIAASSYCQECAERIKKEKTAERVRRYRERKAADN